MSYINIFIVFNIVCFNPFFHYAIWISSIWLGDKLHLNDEGHKLLAAAIKAAMNWETEGCSDVVVSTGFPKLDVEDGSYNDLAIDEAITYTDSIVNGVAHGEGTVTWVESGNTLTTTWENGNPTTGTYLSANECKYLGPFNSSWEFDGEGEFTWPSGWKFVGTFENGKTTTTKTSGLLWYEGAMNGLNDIDSSQLGTGYYRYENTMRYTGQMIAHGALEACTF